MDLVRPARGEGAAASFDFRDLLSLRALVALLDRGVSMRRIRRSVERVRERWPELERPLGALQLQDGTAERLVVRHAGSLLDPDGQLLLDFAAARGRARRRGRAAGARPRPGRATRARVVRARLPARRRERRRCPRRSRPTGARSSSSPTLADAHCNLGTAHYNRGEREAGARRPTRPRSSSTPRIARPTSISRTCSRRRAGARRRSTTTSAPCAADPCFADAHLNLALLYEKIGIPRRGARALAALPPARAGRHLGRGRAPAPARAASAEPARRAELAGRHDAEGPAAERLVLEPRLHLPDAERRPRRASSDAVTCAPRMLSAGPRCTLAARSGRSRPARSRRAARSTRARRAPTSSPSRAGGNSSREWPDRRVGAAPSARRRRSRPPRTRAA